MTGRNDACPCGSGRKYKNCCQSRDRAEAEPLGRLKLPAEVREAAAQAGCWQVEAVPVSVAIDTEADARPVLIMVVAEGSLLHIEMRARLGGEPDQVAAALEAGIVAAAREVGCYAPAVEIRHADLADSLHARLRARNVTVQVSDELSGLQQCRASSSAFARNCSRKGERSDLPDD